MAKESMHRNVHQCECDICRLHPHGRMAREHRTLNRLLAASDERMRRLLAGFVAEQIGRGGISNLARITGLDRKTISHGRRELRDRSFSARSVIGSVGVRMRRIGAGRKRVEAQSPES